MFSFAKIDFSIGNGGTTISWERFIGSFGVVSNMVARRHFPCFNVNDVVVSVVVSKVDIVVSGSRPQPTIIPPRINPYGVLPKFLPSFHVNPVNHTRHLFKQDQRPIAFKSLGIERKLIVQRLVPQLGACT